MNNINAVEFAREWEAAWNRHDLEAVLKHFDDDVVFTSPLAKQLGIAEDGTVSGKDALRRYWTMGLEKSPGLRFQVTSVYFGVKTLVIAFKNQQGSDRAEVLTFRKGLVIAGHGMSLAG